MTVTSATAIAHPNIAFIKYWGNRDQSLRLPENGSISMNLEELTTRTLVTFDSSLPQDIFDLNGKRQLDQPLQRVVSHLNLLRGIRGISSHAHVLSENNFPEGVGIASSASAFAALTMAGVNALGLELSERDLSRLARRGSGSACRSIPTGFVEWYRGNSDIDSFAVSISKPSHWKISDCIAVVETGHKKIGSTEGHRLASTSPLQQARVLDADRRLDICRDAVVQKDFLALAAILELDSNLMHAIMQTSKSPLFYWLPATLEIMAAVQSWRKSGIPAAYTIDAGPNVHVLCESQFEETIKHRLGAITGVQEVLVTHPGGPTKLT
jgi:diphosphomevalonate decarboxylase